MAQIKTLAESGDAQAVVQYSRGQYVGVFTEPLIELDGQMVAPPPDQPNSGGFVGLDRAGCNHLIRSLREARDKAFGRDE